MVHAMYVYACTCTAFTNGYNLNWNMEKLIWRRLIGADYKPLIVARAAANQPSGRTVGACVFAFVCACVRVCL